MPAIYDNELNRYRDADTKRFVSAEQAVNESLDVNAILQENVEVKERLAALELAMENADWRLLTWQARQEFTRAGLRVMTELARVIALKNPLVKRAIAVQQLYVWGQNWSVQANDDTVQEVVTNFLDDPKNAVELTSHTARMEKEKEQQTDGNTFLVFFVNRSTGRVRIRSIQFEEIARVICSPDDAKEPWFYERTWSVQRLTDSGGIETEQMHAYYPDWRYKPTTKRPDIAGVPVMWDTPVMHIKTGGYSNWSFGVSEIYAAIDWSQAYKDFLEDWASIVRAYRRFAFQLTTPGGSKSIAAAKSKLGTTVGSGTGVGTAYDSNPPPVAGGLFISDPNTQLNPVRTQGATVSAEDGRRILLMVAAATGLPETFFGDVSVGTLATANSLDRPTELMMSNRQMFWQSIFEQIFEFVLEWAVKAPQGPLRGMGTLQRTVEDGQVEESVDWGGTDAHIDIDFPPILNEPVIEQVNAIISAATLNGGQLSGTLDIVNLSRMLLAALGEDDIDEIIEELFPGGEVPEWADPEVRDQRQQDMMQQRADDARNDVREAMQEMKAKLMRLWEAQ